MARPTILNVTESGSNSASTSWVASYPAYNIGDLVFIAIANDDNTNVTAVTKPSGPNSETLTSLGEVMVAPGDATPDQRLSIWYYEATSTEVAGTLTFTANASEQWSVVSFRVATGDFDATTPIGETKLGGSAIGNPNATLSAFTAGATDGGGTLLCFASVNFLGFTTTPTTGWTYPSINDVGAICLNLAERTAETTNSESIPLTTFELISGQTTVTFGLIVRAASGVVDHVAVGALTGQSASISGTAAVIKKHAATGSLIAQSASITGAATRLREFEATGALLAQDASISGDAARSDVLDHVATGSLTAQNALIAGTAAVVKKHNATGALTAQDASITGIAARVGAALNHVATGALIAQDAAITGASSVIKTHDATGALVAQSASISGTAINGTEIQGFAGEESDEEELLKQARYMALKLAIHDYYGISEDIL